MPDRLTVLYSIKGRYGEKPDNIMHICGNLNMDHKRFLTGLLIQGKQFPTVHTVLGNIVWSDLERIITIKLLEYPSPKYGPDTIYVLNKELIYINKIPILEGSYSGKKYVESYMRNMSTNAPIKAEEFTSEISHDTQMLFLTEGISAELQIKKNYSC